MTSKARVWMVSLLNAAGEVTVWRCLIYHYSLLAREGTRKARWSEGNGYGIFRGGAENGCGPMTGGRDGSGNICSPALNLHEARRHRGQFDRLVVAEDA